MTVEKLNTLFETPAHVRISSQQYIDDPRSEQKSDLIEGVFVMASPASYLHEDLVTFLIGTLATYVTARKLGKVLGSNAAFELSEDNVYQPDISFILAERLYLARDVYFPGPPDIAIEIISPSSRNYDTVEKKINYARYGVQEYWLIDPIHEQATFYTRVGDQFARLRPRTTCCGPNCWPVSGCASTGSSRLRVRTAHRFSISPDNKVCLHELSTQIRLCCNNHE